MNDQTDQQLLRDYAERQSEPAFAELVRRRVDLVYSAAIRMVGDPHLARDVTQAVFVALAQNALQLMDHPVVSGWLHRTAQNTASKIVRTDVRRRAREQEAAVMNELLSAEPNIVWQNIAPHLDAALGELSEPDRDAVLLRYFECKSAREMAQILGISDEAAQKRVSRAVERLREFFTKRGVTVGAGGLAVAISANAVQAAPAGLAATISTAAALAGTTIATTATKVIAMTALQKTLIVTTIVVAAGSGIYEARQASILRNENQTLLQQQTPLAGQIQQLQRERDDVKNKLASLADELETMKSNNAELLKLRGKVAVLQNTANDPSDIAAKDLVARVNKLKQRLEQTPDAKIPELQLLNDQDWLTASRGWNLDTESGFRQALSALRSIGEQKFANRAQGALAKYYQANNKQYPTDLSQLQPYFNSPVDAAILQRWQILPVGTTIPGIGGEGPFITQKAPVDDLLDTRFAATLNGYASSDFLNSEIQDILMPVYQAYSLANNGLNHDDPSQLLPYATTPEQRAAVQKLMQQSAARK